MASDRALAVTGTPDLFRGGGELGALMRGYDWSSSPLGAPIAWPQPLKTLVGVMLGAGQPMFVAWGVERILLYNDAYAALMDGRHPSALGRPFFDVWHDIVEECVPLFDKVYAGEPVHMDDIELRPDRPGRPREAHFAFSYTPVRDEADSVVGLFCVCSEITEQVAARRREAAEADRQRALFQQMPGFVAVLSGPDHVYEYVNDTYVAISGPRTFVGRTIREVFPELEGQGYYERLDHVYATGETFKASSAPIRLAADPAGRFIDYLFQAIRNARGDISGIFVVGNEVTEREQAQAALRDSEARLRDLNETLEARVAERTAERNQLWGMPNLLVATTGFDTILREVSPGWGTILGWARQELTGRSYADFVHPDDAARSLDWSANLAGGITEPELINRFRHKDGSYRWIAWTSTADRDVFYSVGRDVTYQKQQEEELVNAQESLRQAQKMEAVGQLTGGLAHDFNNLLTGVMGNLELLQLRVARGRVDDLDRFINAAQGAGRRAAALTQRLLAFSRRQTLDPKPTDVNRLIAGLQDMLHRTVGATVDVEVVGAAGLWTVDIDAGQLENAILNLCINGRDAMAAGGRLTIETANTWFDDHMGRERDLAPGQYISICVTDTGTGMSAQTIARAFEPFYTTKPIGQGTGLGLSMIYGFARQSGGQVRIYSEIGQGTTVCIYLPRHHGDAEEVIDGDRSNLAQSVRAQTVLVVDDEATIRHLIDEVLDDLGYTVIGAADGAAGIKVLESGARIDLLITDVGLPNGMNGRQVADAARALRPGLPVLFITGFAENAALGNGYLEPGMELLTKPFTLEALSAKVAEMLRLPDS